MLRIGLNTLILLSYFSSQTVKFSKIIALWDVTPYSLVERYEGLQERVIYIFYLSCEKTLYITSKYFYLLNGGTLRHIPEDGNINPLKPELNPICYLLALLGTHHFLHVSRIRVKLLTLR